MGCPAPIPVNAGLDDSDSSPVSYIRSGLGIILYLVQSSNVISFIIYLLIIMIATLTLPRSDQHEPLYIYENKETYL